MRRFLAIVLIFAILSFPALAETELICRTEDVEYITCDYSGTMTVGGDTLTIPCTVGEMTEDSSEGGSTAYHVEALEEGDRTVALKSGNADMVDVAPPAIRTSGDYDYTVHSTWIRYARGSAGRQDKA